MTLNELLREVKVLEIQGVSDLKLKGIHFDSRKVGKGDAFIAVKGTQADGHQFIEMAVENGVEVVVAEHFPKGNFQNVTFVKVADSAEALGRMASNLYGRPSESLKLVGVTGTNGKTTTATLLHGLLMRLGYKAGLLSTIENKIGETVVPSTHTTPDPVSMNAFFADMVAAGCEFAFMEVSSHAVDQRRIAGLHFAGGIFSNITHDHLDYHKTFDNYIKAKKRFFDDLPKGAFALVNVDDKRGEVMVQNTKATIATYALKRQAKFKAKILENGLHGLHLLFDGFDFHARLIGEFNAYNLLAVYGTARLLGIDATEILAQLSQMKAAEGRFDAVLDPTRNVTAIVDYAHTPDALEKVLETIKKLRQPKARIITVTGCGGDRDKTKRALMGKTGSQLSDLLILTSDNPRSEEPNDIIKDMEAGIEAEDFKKVVAIADRGQAIKTAVQLAQSGDVILLAGKGHEKYQEIKGVKYPFDDKEEVLKSLGFNV